jgi:hypothetical protein
MQDNLSTKLHNKIVSLLESGKAVTFSTAYRACEISPKLFAKRGEKLFKVTNKHLEVVGFGPVSQGNQILVRITHDK